MEDTRDLGELICGTGFNATIVLDTATTGLGSDAELVAVTATDGWGNIVFDTFVKPSCHTEWPEAERIHHISPEAVAHAPQAKEIAPRLAELLGRYGLYVGYGTAFDLAMLQKNGAAIPAGLPVFDVMREFAKVHGKDVSGWRGRWSKLSECCAFYGGTEGSHGAKGGAEACAFCYRSLLEDTTWLAPAAERRLAQLRELSLCLGESRAAAAELLGRQSSIEVPGQLRRTPDGAYACFAGKTPLGTASADAAGKLFSLLLAGSVDALPSELACTVSISRPCGIRAHAVVAEGLGWLDELERRRRQHAASMTAAA